MRFGFVLDDSRPPHTMAAALGIKCAWCGQRKSALLDRNSNTPTTSICRECANKLLYARNLYRV